MDTARVRPEGTPQGEIPPPVAMRTRRRPSGEPPPLPRPVSTTTRVYVALGAFIVGLAIALSTTPGTRMITAIDLPVSRVLAQNRSAPLTDVAEIVVDLGSSTTFRLLAWATLLLLLATRRFQHLFAALALLLVVPVIGGRLRANELVVCDRQASRSSAIGRASPTRRGR